MKHYLYLMLLSLTPFLFVSCGDDEEQAEQPLSNYSIRFFNKIDKSKIASSKSDGNLYDVYIVSSKGELYQIGDLQNQSVVTYTLEKYDSKVPFFLILKLGKNRSIALSGNYYSPEQSYGKLRVYKCNDDGLDIYITESTKYSEYDISDIGEFENVIQSILINAGI